MNILIVCFAWSQQDKGGLGQHVLELAQKLSENSHQVSVISINNTQNSNPYQISDNTESSIANHQIAYNYHDIETLHDMQSPYIITKLIKEKARKIQPDIIHIHHCLYTGFKLLKELSELAPIVHTLHDYFAITPRAQLLDKNQRAIRKISEQEWDRQVELTWPGVYKNSAAKLSTTAKTGEIKQFIEAFPLRDQWINFSNYCLSYCTTLICPSEGAAEIFKLNNINQPITIIENGINSEKLEGKIKREKPRKRTEKIKLLILGAVIPSKGQLLFCKALIDGKLLDLVEVHMHGPIPETYHGETTQQQELKNICKKYPANFFLKGPYAYNQIINIFEDSDILATPSIWDEVYGLVAREGLCYGLPLICTDAAGLRSLKGKINTYTLEIENIAQWPELLSNEFREGKLKQWIKDRRNKIFKGASFIKSTDDYIPKIEQVYLQALTRKPSISKAEFRARYSILLLTPVHSSKSFGGTENAATCLYNYLRFDNTLTNAWLLTSSDPEEHDKQHLHIEPQALSILATAKNPDVKIDALEDIYKKVQPKIIHLQHYLNVGIDIISILKRLHPEVVIVLTLHEYLLICPNDGQMIKRDSKKICINPSPEACFNCFDGIKIDLFKERSALIQNALDACDGLISPSDWLLKQFKQYYQISSANKVIENGLPMELIEQVELLDRSKNNNFPPLNRFAFFGRASERKGLLVLLQACYSLSVSHMGLFQLQIYGGGLEQEPAAIQHRIHALITACGDHVELHGRYRQMQIPQLMQQCDWVIVPSIWWENSPVVIQEAFACHKPVIGSNHGGIAEKINGRGGLGFEPNDAADLAGRMAEAIGNVELHRSLQKQMALPFSIEACAAQHLEFYEELMQRHACG